MKPCDSCDAAVDGRCFAVLADQPTVKEYSADGVWVAEIAIANSGTFSPQHSHSYPHLTHVARGVVRVHEAGAADRVVQAPDAILIPAYTKHLFETLTTDVLLLCIHNVSRSGAVEIADEHQIVEVSPCH